MSACLKRNAELLKLLCRSNTKVSKTILKHASPDLIKSITECSHNVLKGNVPLTSSQKKRLARYKQSLRNLSKKSTSIKHKKKIIQQGGFIGALLRPIVSVLGQIIGS